MLTNSCGIEYITTYLLYNGPTSEKL